MAPTIVGYIKDHTTRGYGYYWVDAFFICVNMIGLVCNIGLYFVDIKYNNAVLNKVDSGDAVIDLMTSPT